MCYLVVPLMSLVIEKSSGVAGLAKEADLRIFLVGVDGVATVEVKRHAKGYVMPVAETRSLEASRKVWGIMELLCQ